MFTCSFFSVITHLTVINEITNDDEGAPGPLNNNQGASGPLTDNQGATRPLIPLGLYLTTRGPRAPNWRPRGTGAPTDNQGAHN